MTHDGARPYRLLALTGDLDLGSAADVRSQIAQALATRPSTLGLDLSRVTFLDCAGLQVLLWAVLRSRSLGARLVLVSPSPAVARTLTVTDSRGCFALAS